MSKKIKQINPEDNYQAEENTKVISETKKNFIAWVKAHKKQLVLAGGGIATIIAAILGIKNKGAIEALRISLEENIKKVSSEITPVTTPILKAVTSTRAYTLPTEMINVSGHIRTMPVGKHHSVKKAIEAASMGITLLPNQTLVDSYSKYAS